MYKGLIYQEVPSVIPFWNRQVITVEMPRGLNTSCTLFGHSALICVVRWKNDLPCSGAYIFLAPPRKFFFFPFFTPNTSQYWILIEFWPEFGFPDVLRAVFVKFRHFRHIFIHKMSSKSFWKHFLALVKKSKLA